MDRRKFISKAGMATAGFSIVSCSVLGGIGFVSPSDKLNIAVIGAGGMGAANTNNCSSQNIVALCDVDFKQAAATFEKYPNAKRYKDYRVMLEKQKDIDAVIVATPDHTHAHTSMASMQLGKDVYVQKPLTHSVYEARLLTEEARRQNVISQMGNQGRSGEGVRRLSEWIWSGAIGDVKEVHCWSNRPVWPQALKCPTETHTIPDTLDWDLWLGPAPERPYNSAYLPFNWRAWLDFGCGALGDMGCHIMDPAFFALKLKYPDWVQGTHSYEVHEMWTKYINAETYPCASMVHYHFPEREGMPSVDLKWYDGGLVPVWPEEIGDDVKIPDNGSLFIGEKGIIMCGTYGGDVQIFPEAARHEANQVTKTLARIETTHELDWIRACKDRVPCSSNFDYSGPLTEMVLMGNLSILYPYRRLYWDGKNMRVTNNDEANRFIKRDYRAGWELE